MKHARMLDLYGQAMTDADGRALIEAVRLSEGRSLASEIIAPAPPLFRGLTNTELASAFGADILILNMYDVDRPALNGFEAHDATHLLKEISELSSRMVGVNLEPVPNEAEASFQAIENGRKATAENARKAYEQGAQMIVLTGNPDTGVTNGAILDALKAIKDALGEKVALVAGKMHSAGTPGEGSEAIIDEDTIDAFISHGADFVMLPAPGTIPGLSEDMLRGWVKRIHRKGALAMSAIGTSQEGSDSDTLKAIALSSKRAGFDLHHLGDAGFNGVAIPENIKDYSIVIRGIRHTYIRMAKR